MDTLLQEKKVSTAFSVQAAGFDEMDLANPTLQWMRAIVRSEVLRIAKAGGSILELNAGTGLDAVFFAKKGFAVHATDNAPGMLDEIGKKIGAEGLEGRLSSERCSFNELEHLYGKKYDHLFSNFGGLNCAEDLSSVIRKMDKLLDKGGTVTLVIMPRVCPWEMMQLFRGKFRLAFRRFGSGGVDSHLEGIHFKTWYYSPRYVRRSFGGRYELVSLKGLASVSPPPYMENFPGRFPRLYAMLRRIDECVFALPLFRSWADHYVISFRKIT